MLPPHGARTSVRPTTLRRHIPLLANFGSILEPSNETARCDPAGSKEVRSVPDMQHLDPFPFVSPTRTLERLDGSGFHATQLAPTCCLQKTFNFKILNGPSPKRPFEKYAKNA